MNSLISLPADFAVDSGAMGHGVASGEGFFQNRLAGKICGHKVRAWAMNQACISVCVCAMASRQQNQLVTFRGEFSRQMPAYKSRSACDCDFHEASLRFKRCRRTICVGHTALRKSPTVRE